MKEVFKSISWLVVTGLILAAFFTQIPFLLTISTAIYWIVAIILPVGLLLTMIGFAMDGDKVFASWNNNSKLQVVWVLIKSFITLGVYALVGWTWPFAFALIITLIVISVRCKSSVVD